MQTISFMDLLISDECWIVPQFLLIFCQKDWIRESRPGWVGPKRTKREIFERSGFRSLYHTSIMSYEYKWDNDFEHLYVWVWSRNFVLQKRSHGNVMRSTSGSGLVFFYWRYWRQLAEQCPGTLNCALQRATEYFRIIYSVQEKRMLGGCSASWRQHSIHLAGE